MKREEILAGVERLRPWFHRIDLGGGIVTKHEPAAREPLDHPLGKWRKIRRWLPEDLAGKSLLDVGCNAGFYSVEAKRRGAARVLGIDAARFQLRQALFVRRVLGLDIDFRRMSVYDLSPNDLGQFDITLVLGLLYHCKHLVLALERLAAMTRELLIIETAILTRRKAVQLLRRLLRMAKPARWEGVPVHLLGYAENPPGTPESAHNWFLPGVDFLQSQLTRLGFTEIEVEAEGDRAILVCRKGRPYPDSRALRDLSTRLTVERGAAVCRAGEEIAFRVRAENTGWAIWLAAGEGAERRGAVRLGAHLLREDGEDIVWNYGGAHLEADVGPNGVAHFELRVRAPAEPGRYFVEFDLASEHLSWFEDLGSPSTRHELLVTG